MRDGEQPEIGHRYFVAQVAQISRRNARANTVNSTELVWSRLVRDQEDGGSNPLAPTNPFATINLWNLGSWYKTKTSAVQICARGISGRAFIAVRSESISKHLATTRY